MYRNSITFDNIVCNAISKSGHFASYSAVIATTFAQEGTKTGGYQGGVLS